MLWLTRAGIMSGCTPGFGTLLDLFRTVHAEDDNAEVINLNLSPETDLLSSGTISIIITILSSLFDDAKTLFPDDCDFVEQDGLLYVQHTVEDKGLRTADAQAETAPNPAQDRLFQNNQKLKITLGQPGLLESSSHYVDNDKFSEPLSADSIEVKVLATGLNVLDVMAALSRFQIPTFGREVVSVITEVGSDAKQWRIGQTVVAPVRDGFASQCLHQSRFCNSSYRSI